MSVSEEAALALAAFNKIGTKINELLERIAAAKNDYLAIIQRTARGERVPSADWRRAEDKITLLTRDALRLRLVLQAQARMMTEGAAAEVAAVQARQIATALAVLAPVAGNA